MSFLDLFKKPKEKPDKITSMIQAQKSTIDPLGSYTGVPTEPGEKPTQDADDL